MMSVIKEKAKTLRTNVEGVIPKIEARVFWGELEEFKRKSEEWLKLFGM